MTGLLVLYQMAFEVTLGNFNVMPAQAGIYDFPSASCFGDGWGEAVQSLRALHTTTPIQRSNILLMLSFVIQS